MNEKAVELLAGKLGTTAEYLWGVLLKQAPISAATDIVQYVLIVVAVFFWCRWLIRVIDKKEESYGEKDAAMVLLGVAGIILGAAAIVAFFSFPTTISALVNPEYWALNRILGAAK